MSKKIIIFLVIILILVIAGGFFWWWQGREIKGSPKDYVIKETAEGKFVENRRAGLTVKVPEGWRTERVEDKEGLMIFYSSDAEGLLRDNRISPPLENGCIIDTSVVYEHRNINQLKVGARYNLSLLGAKSIELEEITVNNYPALKTIADTEKIGPGIGVDIPHKNKSYSFLLIYAQGDKDYCIQEFDNFLETVSIK